MTSRYRYRQYRPTPHRYAVNETPGHQVAYTVRTDILIPEGKRSKSTYLTRCTCGWSDPAGDYVSMNIMGVRWDAHMMEVGRQEALWPSY